jgi:hypothetical protein
MDWNDFASKVPAGSQAQFLSRYSDRWAEGIILENKPFALMDRDEKSVFHQEALRFQGFDAFQLNNDPTYHIEPERMLYLIGGEWLTIIQVMMRTV